MVKNGLAALLRTDCGITMPLSDQTRFYSFQSLAICGRNAFHDHKNSYKLVDAVDADADVEEDGVEINVHLPLITDASAPLI